MGQRNLRPAPQDDSALETGQEDTYRKRVLKTYFVRFHMSLILTSVIATGVLSSRFLLHHGFHSMPLRYGIAVIASYCVFLFLVRIWIWWITSAKLALDLSLLNSGGNGGGFSFGGGSSGSSGGGAFGFGGGSSGGGGASGSWEGEGIMGPSGSPMQASLINSGTGSYASSGNPLSGSWMPDLPDIDGDDWWILLILAAFVLAILGSGGYLIYAAPQILPEAAWQAALAGGLHRMTKQKPDWKMGVLKSSAVPLVIVLTLAVVLGWQAQRKCPSASKLMEVFSCPTDLPPTDPPADQPVDQPTEQKP